MRRSKITAAPPTPARSSGSYQTASPAALFARRGCSSPERRGASRYYYRCAIRWQDGKDACANRRTINASDKEPQVWEFVSGILKDPDRLRAGLEEMIEQKKRATRRDPEGETCVWLDKLSEVDRKRSACQDQQTEGLRACFARFRLSSLTA